MADIDPSEMPGAIVDSGQTPAQNVDVTDIDPQSAQALLGLKQLGQSAANAAQSQWQQGGERIHQALQGDPGSNPQARAALEELGSQAAMSTVGKGKEVSPAEWAVNKYNLGPKKLAMDEASRIGRAEDLGFNTDAFHGTKADIASFDPNALGASTGANSARKAFFFAEDPSTASDYANISNSRLDLRRQVDPNAPDSPPSSMDQFHLENELKGLQNGTPEGWKSYLDQLKQGQQSIQDKLSGKIPRGYQPVEYLQQKLAEYPDKISDVEYKMSEAGQKERTDRMSEIQKQLDAAEQEKKQENTGQNVIPVKLRMENPYIHDFEGADYRDTPYSQIIDEAKAKGHDSVIFKNTFDPADPENRIKQNIYAVFEPHQVRSKFAEFNPKKAKSGNLSYADGGQVPTPTPTGSNEPAVDPSDIPGAITDDKLPPAQGDQGIDPADQPGAIPEDQFTPDETAYTTPGQQAIAGLEGAAQGFAGPVAPYLETHLGLTTPEAMLQREQQNPALFTTAKIGGGIAGLATGAGEMALVGKIGEAAASAAGLTKAASLSARIGAGALKGATEMGLLSAGDEATRNIINDPNQSMQTSLIDMGLSAALGGGFGGAFTGAGILLKEGLPKLAQEIENFKGQMNYRTNVPEPVTAMHEELSARYNELKDMYDETYGAQGLKARAIAQSVPVQMTDSILGQANSISDNMTNTIKNMRLKPYSYPDRLVGKLEADLNEYKNKVFPIDGSQPSTQDVFNATQDLKQMTQGYAKYGQFIKPTDEAYDFSKAASPIAKNLKASLEDSSVWGDAANLQQNINSNFVKFKPFIEGFEKSFTDKVPDIETGQMTQRVSLGKLQTYLNQAGGFRDAAKKNILKGFLDNGEKYASGLADAYDAVGAESPFTPSPMVVARRSLEETTPGMKVANAFVDKGLGEGAAKGLGAGVGGIAGHALAGPYGAGIGAYVGEKVLGPMFHKMLPAIAKPLLETVANARGFRMAGRVIESALKGDQMLSQGAKNVFKTGAEVLPVSAIPSMTSIGKLNTRLVAAQKDPTTFAQSLTNNPLGSYMPQHAQSMAQTVGNATNYLNALRPDTSKKAPLDSSRTPSTVQQGAYHSALKIAEQPLTVMSKVKDGTITPDDIKHITSMYPAAFDQMKAQLANAMAEHVGKGKSVPYKTRIGLSLFMGQPMDSTFTPQAIQSAQPIPAQAQGPQATPNKGPTKSSTKDLHKISEQAMTPGQAREQRQGSGK